MNNVSITNAQRNFNVQRNEDGVPHIEAATWLDALYGLGFLHAVDRGTQLLFARTVAAGQAAGKISGKTELLETDSFFRRMGLHLNLQEDLNRMTHTTLDEVSVYCAGVNDGIRSKGRSLPMWATGYSPEPWNAAAVILVGRLLSFGGLAVSQLQNERLLIELTHAGARDAAMKELFEPRLNDLDFDLLRQVKISNQLSDEALELLVDLPRLAGSNAWAVSPARSATGHALMAADPHLEVNRLPAIWYEAVLKWDDQYVMGATLPGCPLFAVARTRQLSWGATYMKGDTIDYFIEECRPGGRTGWQYRREEEWLDFELRTELIARKGDPPLPLRVYENSTGTLDLDPEETGAGLYLSTAWVGRKVESARAISTWLDLVKSPSVAAAMDIAIQCPQPTLCFVMADADGHIGLQGCGSFPKRRTPYAGLAPQAAWDTANHWDGWLPKSLLPSQYDPREGFIATANEENNPPHGPLLVTQTVHDYRLRRIQERLRELDAATVADMQALQYDVTSLQARDLLAIFLPLMQEGPLKERLSQWDYTYHTDSKDASLFSQFYRNVMVQVFGHERAIGWRRMLYLVSRAGFSSMFLTAADRLLQRDDSWWWHGRSKQQLIQAAVERTTNLAMPPWSEVNNFQFVNRFFGSSGTGRLLGYNSKKKPMRGCHATPFQGYVFQTATRESTFAPSYHFVTDMGEDRIWTNLPGGPSESRFSKFYRNDIPRWLEGSYKSLSPNGD